MRKLVLHAALACLACSQGELPTTPMTGTVAVQVVRHGDNQPLANAQLELRREADGSLVFEGKTGTDGWVNAALQPGSYLPGRVPPPGYSFSNGLNEPLPPARISVSPASSYRTTWVAYPLSP